MVGVEDRTRKVRGVSSPLEVEEKLANIISDGIHPLLSPDISILPWRKTHLVAVEVYPSSLRPHHVRKEGQDHGIYVRVGSTNRRADGVIVADMTRQVRNESFDEQPMPTLSSEAINFRAASELFRERRALKRGDLLTLRLTAKHQRTIVPTVAGILLFGKDRQAHFPDAWIQVGRFRGADRSKILDTVSLRSLPVKAIDESIAFIRKHVSVESRIEGIRRNDLWPIPLPAIREAVINAVVHADYSQSGAPIRISVFDDRIEIENPGLLPFGLTVEDIRHGISKLRNRAVGRVFHELGLIEQWGSGIQRIVSTCRDAGLKQPAFEEIGVHFRVRLYSERERAHDLDAIDQAILSLLDDGQGRSTSDISEHIGRSTRATRTRLVSLIERGLVREVGTGPRDPHRRYFAAHR